MKFVNTPAAQRLHTVLTVAKLLGLVLGVFAVLEGEDDLVAGSVAAYLGITAIQFTVFGDPAWLKPRRSES